MTNNVKNKFKTLLNECGNWEHHEDKYDDLYYYTQDADYYISLKEIEYSEPHTEPFSLFYDDEELYIGRAFFKVRNTTISSCEYVYCDGFRVSFPTPELGFSDPNPEDIHPDRFYYYLLDSLEGAFVNMLTPSKFKGRHPSGFPYILFNNKEEMYAFSKFLKEFNEEIEVPKEYYPAMSLTAIELKNKNEFFRNTDLDSLRRNKYIYENKYKKLK